MNILIDENCKIMYNKDISKSIDLGDKEIKIQLIRKKYTHNSRLLYVKLLEVSEFR